MQSTFKIEKEKSSVRRLIAFFMIALIISGLTAIPLEWGLSLVKPFFAYDSPMGMFLEKVYRAIRDTGNKYPFLFYGYDWLAFAHIIIALVFIGPWKDPVRNKWVIEFGIYACILVIPFALIVGGYRGLPFSWRLIDCSFGVIGIIPLVICLRKINEIEYIQAKEALLQLQTTSK